MKRRDRSGIVGSVVEFSPATRETGVRFPDNAILFHAKRNTHFLVAVTVHPFAYQRIITHMCVEIVQIRM